MLNLMEACMQPDTMQSIGQLVSTVLAILRTKLDGKPITTYLDVSKEENPK